MKLHLPKQLLKAVLLAASTFAAYTVNAADSISINFTHGEVEVTNETKGELGGVGASGWNNVAAGDTGGVSVHNQEGEDAGTISISNVKNSWHSDLDAGDTITSVVQNGYIDAPNNEKRYYSVNVDHDYWLTDVTLYMSADTAGQYASLNVNGVSYKGGDNTTIGSGSWGTIPDPSGVTEYNGDNSFTVTNVIGDLVVSNEYSDGNRATLAGLQVVDRSDIVYTSTLSENAVLADVAWSKVGVEGTVNLSGITGDKYLSVAAEGENRTLDINADTAINGLQLTSNSLTLISTTDKTLTVGALHANEGTVLTANVKLAGKDLALTGKGEIQLSDYAYTGAIGVGRGTTLTLLAGQKTGKIENNGTVLIDAGSSDILLYKLIGKGTGNICASDKIANTASGNIIIEHTGHKTTDGGVNVATGGTITLKGGSAAIGHVINVENDTTLAFQDITASIGGGGDQQLNASLEIGSGATLNLTSKDVFNWSKALNIKVLTGGVLNLGSTFQSLSQSAVVELAGGKIIGAGGANQGYTLGLDFYSGGTINVTENSTLSTGIGGHLSGVLTINVSDGKTLLMDGSFDGGGSFAKSGAGALLYQGASFSKNIAVNSGVFEFNCTENRTYGGTLSGSGTFKKSGTGTLQLSATSSIGTLDASEGTTQISGSLTVDALTATNGRVEVLENGVLSFTNIIGESNLKDILSLTGDKLVTQGSSYLLLAPTAGDNNDVSMTADMVQRSNVVVNGRLDLHGRSWDGSHVNGHVLTIDDGSYLKIGANGTDELRLVGRAKVNVTGESSLYAGKVTLGYSSTQSTSSYGVLSIDSGSAKLQEICFEVNQGNAFQMTGGRVEFTGEEVMTRAVGTSLGSFAISGGEWVVNTTQSLTQSGDVTVSLGGVELLIAEEKTLTLGGALTITGTLTHNGEGTLAFADGTGLFVSSDAFEHMTSVGLGVEAGTNGMGSIGYYLVSGTGATTYGENISLTVDGGSEGYSFENGLIVTQSETYIINGEKSTADATTDSVFADASSYQVNAGGKFTLAGNMPERPDKTVAALLTSVTGTGTLLVTSEEITLASGTSVFEGDVQVESGSTLTLGDGQNQVIDFSSLNSIVLNGGNVKWNAKGGNLKQLTVKADSDWTIFDMAEGTTLSIGEVSVEKDATLTVNKTGNWAWKQWINIDSLVGEGSVAINGPGSTKDGDGKVSSLVINSLKDFTGNLSITGRQRSAEKDRYNATVNTGLAGATLGSLSITGFGEPGESSTATFNVQGNTTIGSTSMAGATMVLDSGVVLTLGNDTTNSEHTLGTVKASAGGNVIDVKAGAVLSAVSKTQDSGAITLKGSGTYSLTGSGMFLNSADAMALNVTGVTSSEWTGTVRLSNATMGKLNIDDYAHAGSTVEFVGVTAWLENVNTRRAATVLLSKEEGRNGLIIHDNSNQTYQFGGKVKGEGDFTVQSKSENTSGFTFGGDISEWSGGFVVAQHTSSENAATMTVNLTGGGTLFAEGGKGVVMDRKGTLNVNIGNSGDSVMRGGIGFGDTTKTGTLNVTVQGNTRFEQDVTATRFVVNNGKSATIGGESVGIAAGSVSFSKQNATLSNVTVSGSSIAKTGGSAGSIAGADISLAELAAGSSFSISDMALSNVTVSAATADTAVNLTNITASAVQLAQGSFTMTNQAVVDFHGVEGSKACFTTDLLSGITLNNAGNAASLAVDLGDLADVADLQDGKTYDLSITLSGFTMMNYEDGIGLVFSADSWLGQLLAEHGATEYVSGSLEAPEAVASTSSVKVTYTDGGANVGTIVTITGLGEVVPEPASATLSLAALMMLCARRRRK